MKHDRLATPASSDKEVLDFKKAADAYVRKVTISTEAADSALMKLGIHTRKGKLTKPYR